MPASTVTRSTWTDDDGSGTTGTIINNAELQKVYDAVDALLAGTGSYTTLNLGGLLKSLGSVYPYVAKTAIYTVGANDYCIDCTANTFTVTLPTAVGITGQVYQIKNSGAGVITVGTTSSQTIDGSTTYSLSIQYQSVTVMSNGANWIVL